MSDMPVAAGGGPRGEVPDGGKNGRVMEGVAAWCAFYRDNPQRFVKDYLNVDLKRFQKILIYEMIHNNHFMFWSVRSIGKTWLTALFGIVRGILFPKSKICVVSSTRSQANEVLLKITDDFMKNYGWGSDNLAREISYCSVASNRAVVSFRNGSWIKVATASDNGRGMRANVLVVDEFRLVDRVMINTVLRRFLGTPRQPAFLYRKEYRDNPDLLETNKEIYMGSAGARAHWSYDMTKSYTVNMLGGRPGYFVCGFPYQLAIMEGLKKRSEIEDEMSEADFDDAVFDMEMCCIPLGSGESSFFAFDDISRCRKLRTAAYPPDAAPRAAKVPALRDDERRILSVDIALMASKKHRNDASSVIINSAIPAGQNNYKANIIYLCNYEGLVTEELALEIRRLFKQFRCTDLVIDCQGVGMGVYDCLIQDMVDYKTGEVYPALSCCNDRLMAERCKVDGAPKVIWSIKASAQFNTDICILLRSGFQNRRINLLVSEFEAEEYLKEGVRGYGGMPDGEKLDYKMPFIQTTLLVYELISLESEMKGTNIKIKEKSGRRKDRYSSLAYNYWVMCQLEREVLRKKGSGFDMGEYAERLKKLNRRPVSY